MFCGSGGKFYPLFCPNIIVPQMIMVMIRIKVTDACGNEEIAKLDVHLFCWNGTRPWIIHVELLIFSQICHPNETLLRTKQHGESSNLHESSLGPLCSMHMYTWKQASQKKRGVGGDGMGTLSLYQI